MTFKGMLYFGCSIASVFLFAAVLEKIAGA